MRTPGRQRLILGLLLVIATGAGLTAWQFRGRFAAEKNAAEQTASGPRAITVTTAQAVARPVKRTIEIVGTLKGFEEVNLGAKVEGRVKHIHHEVGEEVAPGEPLVDLDDTDYKLALSEAQRALDMELAKLGLTEMPRGSKVDLARVPAVARAKNVEENSRQIMDRARRMSVGRVIGNEELEKAQTEARVALSNREQAELEAYAILATARLRQAQVDTAKQRLQDCKVIAPLPSPSRLPPGIQDPQSVRYIVAKRETAEGEMIRAMPATTLFQLVIDQPLKLLATVPERFLSEVKAGQSVSLNVEAYPGTEFKGTVARINPTVDRGNRTFSIEVSVPNTSRRLRPGSFVKAKVLTRQEDQALTVPEEAVVRFAGVIKVYVVENDQARIVPVRLGEVVDVVEGDRPRRWIEVTGPIKPGARVVTSGQSMLADQTPVQIR